MQSSHPLATPMLLKTVSQDCSPTWVYPHSITHECVSKPFPLNEVAQRCILGGILHCGQHCYLELMVEVVTRYHSNLFSAWFKFTTAHAAIRPDVGFTN